MAVSKITEVSQYLTFKLREELFAVDIVKVREVLEFNQVTKVPRTPEFMRGIINLRGDVVPVMDLRLKFGMLKTEKAVNTCIIMVEITSEENSIILGLLADSVQEVLEIEPSKIDAAPNIGMHLNSEYIQGMGKHGNVFIIILDINKIFTAEELASVKGSVD
ncbi:MAG: chemotaxis protein CheW [Candidatus Magnetoovum sp. WYHC-5]|nr:chemotaxis protein CheW [Candidatus Magnetoovum sp. WYHC-5]